jgi:hypothetical protein
MMVSKQQVDVLEIKDKIAKVNTVNDEHGQVIKIFRFNSGDHKKLIAKIRTCEGMQGSNLSFFIIPQANTDWSTTAVIEVPLKPLSQHERISTIPMELQETLPWSSV